MFEIYKKKEIVRWKTCKDKRSKILKGRRGEKKYEKTFCVKFFLSFLVEPLPIIFHMKYCEFFMIKHTQEGTKYSLNISFTIFKYTMCLLLGVCFFFAIFEPCK